MTAALMSDETIDTGLREVRSFRAMGTTCRVLVDGPCAHELAEIAELRIALLEQCWSRFRADSELMQLNARAGAGAVTVSEDLLALVSTMKQAWRETDGLFDPTVIDSMTALGYDRDFAQVARSAIAAEAIAAAQVRPAPGMSNVGIDYANSTITLPAGIGLDPGALGKGLAADIVVGELRAAGARAVMVDLGGDIVVAGTPNDGAWIIEIEDARTGESTGTVVTFPADAGAIATSTTLKRVWGARHHVIDPRTGDVANTDLVQATVAADAGWRAEASATCALLLGAGKADAWLQERELAHVLIGKNEHSSEISNEIHTMRTINEGERA